MAISSASDGCTTRNHVKRGEDIADKGDHRKGAGKDRGSATAEYAVVTLAACGFAGLLLKLLTGEAMTSLLSDLLQKALQGG
jgi:hypothetical protein